MTQELDAKLIERMRKLLALATNNDNEHQASAAMAKLQEMLEAHNLDMAVLGTSGKGAQRSDTKKTGGLYSWQRRLWQSVAELNFCFYFSIKGLARGSVYEHRLVGSHANVIATEMMAKYLQETVERLAQQWAKDNLYKSVFVREAIAYREGMSTRICDRLSDRRHEIIEKAKQEAEERKRDQARAAMSTTGTELTILDVISSEADYNNDYLHGYEMGTTARNRAESEARQAAYEAGVRQKAAEYAEWKRLNPELAAAREKKTAEENAAWWAEWEKKNAKRQARVNKTPPKPRYRNMTAEEQRAQMGSYYEGHQAGNNVGIDTQVDAQARKAVR